MTSTRWTAARFGVAGLLAGLGLAWGLGTGRLPAARAAVAAPAEAAGTIAFTSGEPGGAQWLYLIDTKTQALAVYRLDPRNTKGSIKLEAARQYRWDLKLAEYNNAEPGVQAISSMVGEPRR